MLTLRELERKDLEIITGWRGDRSMIDCLGAPYRYIGPEIDEAWFNSYLTSRANTVRTAIVDDVEPEKILGLATLSSIDWVVRSCKFHIQIGPEAQGKGLGSFAINEMLRHAFFDLGLNRVELAVLETNTRAQHLYKKMGFKQEGLMRQASYKNGKYVALFLMSILREEWDEQNSPDIESGDADK